MLMESAAWRWRCASCTLRHATKRETRISLNLLLLCLSQLGVGDYYPLLAAMLSGRPWADILASEQGSARLKEKGTAEDKAQIAG